MERRSEVHIKDAVAGNINDLLRNDLSIGGNDNDIGDHARIRAIVFWSRNFSGCHTSMPCVPAHIFTGGE